MSGFCKFYDFTKNSVFLSLNSPICGYSLSLSVHVTLSVSSCIVLEFYLQQFLFLTKVWIICICLVLTACDCFHAQYPNFTVKGKWGGLITNMLLYYFI